MNSFSRGSLPFGRLTGSDLVRVNFRVANPGPDAHRLNKLDKSLICQRQTRVLRNPCASGVLVELGLHYQEEP